MGRDRTPHTVSDTPQAVKSKREYHPTSKSERPKQRRPQWTDPVLPISDELRAALNNKLAKLGRGGPGKVAAAIEELSGTPVSRYTIRDIAIGKIPASGAARALAEYLGEKPPSEFRLRNARAMAQLRKLQRLEAEAPKMFARLEKMTDQALEALDAVRRMEEGDDE